MCGIVGFIGQEQAAPILLDGLAHLEYRGYDSAGVAVISAQGKLQVEKAVGRLRVLSEQIHGGADLEGCIGLGHTRWATHGAPNIINSHPHVSENGKFAVIHNGIIENYVEIKEFLIGQGIRFKSETDTEVVAQLLEFYYNECHDFLEAVGRVLRRIEGAYALGMLCADCPDRIIAARKDAPLLLGFGKGENFIAMPFPVTVTLDHDYDEEEKEAEAVVPMGKGGAADEELFAMLKDLRKKVAKQHGLPPFVIFQDPSLEDMAVQYPITIEEMQNITGVGVGKARKFGEEFVKLIKAYVEEKEIIRPQDMIVKSVGNKSGNKIFIIQSIDRKMDFEDIARAKDLDFDELLTEIEGIVNSGTKLDISYYLRDFMDEDKIEDIYLYFKEDAESDSLDAAIEELGADYTEEEIRLVRIKFMCEQGN